MSDGHHTRSRVQIQKITPEDEIRALRNRGGKRPDRVETPADLLLRLREWDHMQTTGDGPYWISEIDKVLAAHTTPDRVAEDAQRDGLVALHDELGPPLTMRDSAAVRHGVNAALALLRSQGDRR